jgi:hypothetical protein
MFKEPSWNNPVVRFIKSDKSDIIAKIKRNWSTKHLVNSMVLTLKTQQQPIPVFLDLLNQDVNGFKKPESLPNISKSLYRFLPLGYAQSAAIEAALSKNSLPSKYLSPAQVKIFKAITQSPSRNWPVATGKDFVKSWTETSIFNNKK